MIIGLTGQSGSSKSTVSRIFADKGFFVIDADRVSREVTAPGMPALKDIEAAFGSGFIEDDGSLARRKLGSLVFSDRHRLDILEGILYSYILRRIDELAEGHENVLIDAPTLFDAGCEKKCDIIIGVVADESIRLERIKKRDNISEEDARKRFSSQHSADFFRERCDLIIENNGTQEELIQETLRTADRFDI